MNLTPSALTMMKLADEPSESRLVSSGDERLATLMAQELDFVWRSLRRLGVPASSVDDATQRVWLIVARKLPHILQGSERAFLFGTAMRIASEARRKIARRQEVLGPVEVTDPAPGAEELLSQQQARRVLDEVLEALPDDLRAVFILYELEEQTAAEIASMLSLPPGTVASRLRRARSAFEVIIKRLKARRQSGGSF
ncbi:MAG TPA: sigma-70 family RNA polymerase sigma factor [Polyangiaceae bacterium]|nr:sigma-70 family RNA polymerase sigma factor [Polyangiaceae bacterium]